MWGPIFFSNSICLEGIRFGTVVGPSKLNPIETENKGGAQNSLSRYALDEESVVGTHFAIENSGIRTAAIMTTGGENRRDDHGPNFVQDQEREEQCDDSLNTLFEGEDSNEEHMQPVDMHHQDDTRNFIDLDEGSQGERESLFPKDASDSLNHSMEFRNNLGIAARGRKQGQMISPLCISMSDSEIRNCNDVFWLRHRENEARELWNLGKSLGLRFRGDDEEVIRQLIEMEVRDEQGVRRDSNQNGGLTNQCLS